MYSIHERSPLKSPGFQKKSPGFPPKSPEWQRPSFKRQIAQTSQISYNVYSVNETSPQRSPEFPQKSRKWSMYRQGRRCSRIWHLGCIHHLVHERSPQKSPGFPKKSPGFPPKSPEWIMYRQGRRCSRIWHLGCIPHLMPWNMTFDMTYNCHILPSMQCEPKYGKYKTMGWLRSVESIKSWISFAEYSLFF